MITSGLRLALVALLIGAATPAFAQHGEHGGSVAGDRIAPGNSFARGLHLLHNFEYDRARAAFVAARAADPGNVMAAWGEAMSHNYPLWMDVDLDEGRAALAKLGKTSAERHAKAGPEKEHLYLAAIEALYEGPTKIGRDMAYNRAMEAMFARFPDDVDVRTFAALSIMGLAHNGREIPLYMRAAAMLEEAYPTNQQHPGVLHYMIHAYDDPDHAPLGLRAAQRYAAVAPDAGHAMHMTSHIYLALGAWADVEKTNAAAMAIVDGQRAAAGKGANACGHYAEWMVYAQLQQGRDPQSMVDACRRQVEQAAIARDGPTMGSSVGSWSDMASRVAVDTGRAPAAIAVPQGDFPLAHFWTAYARMIADGPQQAEARRSLAASGPVVLAGLAKNRPNDKSSPGWIGRAMAQSAALSALADGRTEAGLAMLRAAAAAERALPVEFGPPALPKPSSELLADHLLTLGRKAEAAAAYRAALTAAPGRRRALAGLAEATGSTP